MPEEAISSGGTTNAADAAPAASSAGASSLAIPANVGSADGSGHGPGSKTGSPTCVGTQPIWTSLGMDVGDSALGTLKASCRPWERGDLLRRLATFKPSNWFGKPKTASTLSCARYGWVNVDVDKIECETCGASLKYTPGTPWISAEGEGFAKQLDLGHKGSCAWRGNSCPESLVQFPPTPPSALIGGYKDRCDGLLQFAVLPVVAVTAIEKMRESRGPQVERLLAHSLNSLVGESGIKAENITGIELFKEETFSIYSRAQKLTSLCGWEPRWLLDVQDCEDNSAQSARNGCSVGPSRGHGFNKDSGDPGPSKKAFSTTANKDSGKNDVMGPESKCESRSPLLDCSLCGATVRIWDFITVSRPARVAPNGDDIPETSKKMTITRGISAASGISGWVATDGTEKEQTEYLDEAATTDEAKFVSNEGMDLNLTMGGGLSTMQLQRPDASQKYHNDLGKDLTIGQQSNSEAGDRAASFESRGPTNRKRSLEEGGSTVDRPLRIQPADSFEGTVIDRDNDEADDGQQYSAGPSKRFRDSDAFGRSGSSFWRDSSGAGPSHSQGFETQTDAQRLDFSHHGDDQFTRFPSTRDSTHASSVIAMDTYCHSTGNDSMESVENYPGDTDDVNFPSTSKNPDVADTSENQAQQSACFPPAVARNVGEMGISSTNDEEVLNAETATGHARDGFSVGISGGSVGMGASHEAEVHGTDIFIQRADSCVGDVEPVAEVIENQGQTGEFAPEPGLMDGFVDQQMDREDPHGDSQDMVSQSMGRADSGSKVVGSTKADSIGSGEKGHENSVHPSLSCNAVVYSGHEASKEEVTQGGKRSSTDAGAYLESNYLAANVPPNGESNYEEGVEFDPLKHHNPFCPWVNGNVAAAGCISNSASAAAPVALCGWQLTLDALDTFQSVGHVPVQPVESESAASLYKYCLIDCDNNATMQNIIN
ncbi:hypothetical protein V2J09_020058 [Rumex salicifolius]